MSKNVNNNYYMQGRYGLVYYIFGNPTIPSSDDTSRPASKAFVGAGHHFGF